MAAKVNAIYGEALERKESIGNELKAMWLNKRLFEWF